MNICKFNDAINYMEVDLEHLAEGLDYTNKCGKDAVRIGTLNHKDGEKMVLDLRPLRNATFLKKLIIQDTVKITKVIDIEAVETLPNLKSLQLEAPIKIDLSRLTSLEKLGLTTDRNIEGLNTLPNLKRLLISSVYNETLHHIDKLTSLKELRVLGPKLKSLAGIEKLVNLTLLNTSYCASLTDISAINSLPNPQKLEIERCKRLVDLSVLAGNNTICDLFASDVQSLDFIPTMHALKKFRFWNCIEGNLNPLLESQSLIDFYFYPNKRHYTHKLEEIHDLFEKSKATETIKP